MTEDYDDLIYRLQTLHQQKQQRETVDAMNEAADAITNLRQEMGLLEDQLRGALDHLDDARGREQRALRRAESAEDRLSTAMEALREAERIYWREGKGDTWRAAHMKALIAKAIHTIEGDDD